MKEIARKSVFIIAACVAVIALVSPVVHGVGISSHRDDLSPKDQARVAAVTALPKDFSKPQRFETMSGGATTSRVKPDRNAFSHHSANLETEERVNFFAGNGLFEKLWVASPSSTIASDGLGPLFNARSCQRCHVRDGRGHPPTGPDDIATTMVVRLSVPPRSLADKHALASKALQRIPEPTYGAQFHDFAVPGLSPEGQIKVTYDEFPFVLNEGETVWLRRPKVEFENLAYGEMDAEVMISPRVAPPMIGLGLLEAIHPGDILTNADPDDFDGDGVSGRPNMVRNPATGEIEFGRFGWKATHATVETQTAAAFLDDIGISSRIQTDPYGDCTENQTACRAMPVGIQPRLGDSEAPSPVLELVTFYSKNLAVPARRNVDEPGVLRGKELFHSAGCAACHTPSYVTSRDAVNPEHRFQLIWPYTDLLLHDMGEGLADNRPVAEASGREWRTPPLWGIGLTKTVSGHTYFLHDGRARNLLEAILWHGGEAQASRDAVARMTRNERADLIRFLESL
ncbi:MAG: di-heme oxidoredictase family protein [Pseudomonadota bacterium]